MGNDKNWMRIDALLNKLCLTKTRSIAQKACQKSLVKLNDKIAKPSEKVFVGDKIEFCLAGYTKIVDILQIPKGNVSKSESVKFYELKENRRDLDA